MKSQCASRGCGSLAVGFSYHCTRHRKAITRHGHPEQTAVSVHELAPYVRMVKARQKANPTSPAWAILEARWSAIVARSRSLVFEYQQGQVAIRHYRVAAEQFNALAVGAAPTTVIHTALAMHMLRAYRPHRFQSDQAFRHQLVRRVRGLVDTNAGTYWDHKSGRVKRVYRDLPPRVAQVMADELVAAFGGPGVQLADLEKHQENTKRDEQRKLADALGSLN